MSPYVYGEAPKFRTPSMSRFAKFWRRLTKRRVIGFTVSAFDPSDAEYALMLKECKENCDILIVALQSSNTRYTRTEALRPVDQVVEYRTEADLLVLLENLTFHVRFIGEDWQGREYTGKGLNIPILSTSHGTHRERSYF